MCDKDVPHIQQVVTAVYKGFFLPVRVAYIGRCSMYMYYHEATKAAQVLYVHVLP